MKILRGVLVPVAVAALGYVALQDSFRLSLFGDDWLSFWRYNYHLGPHSSGRFNHLTYLLTVYGPQDMAIGSLQWPFGYTAHYYFILSFGLRQLAAFSLYPLIYSLTFSHLAAFVAAAFFSVTFIGIDTTNWVFNMPSYLAVVSLNSLLYVTVVKRKTVGVAIAMAVLFALTLIIQPIRMTGLPLIVLFVELLWLVEQPSATTARTFAVRLVMLSAAFLCVKYGAEWLHAGDVETRPALGDSRELADRVLGGLSLVRTALGSGNAEVLLNPFILVGSMFLPDIFWTRMTLLQERRLALSVALLAAYALLIGLVGRARGESVASRQFYVGNLAPAALWTLLVGSLQWAGLVRWRACSGCEETLKFCAAVVGGYFCILTLSLMREHFRRPPSVVWGLVLVITLGAFVVPWVFAPTGYYSTSHRYVILSAVGISMFWAGLTAHCSRSRLLYAILPVIIGGLAVQVSATRTFFAREVAARGDDIADSVWGQLRMELPDLQTERHPLVFYFEGESSSWNSDTLYEVITFGFSPRVALLYDIYHDDDKVPIPLSDYKELIDIVLTGSPMTKYARPRKPLPVDHIYAFRLEGRRHVKNITAETRQRLRSLTEKAVDNGSRGDDRATTRRDAPL